jgi:hypothetical protein
MSERYDVDAEIAEALQALKEARTHLSRASFGLEQQAIKDPISFERAVVIGEQSGSLNTLATAVSDIASDTRRLRKIVRLWKGGAA